MLSIPSPTPYDLNFSLFRIPIRVHPLFWLGSFIFAFGWAVPFQTTAIPLFMAVIFLSILIHELGHGLTGRYFGGFARITFAICYGLCETDSGRHTRLQRILVILGGPMAGLVFGGLLWFLARAGMFAWVYPFDLLASGLNLLILINIFWSLINLIPIYPLDGGQLLGELLSYRLRSDRAMRYTHGVGLVLGLGLAILLFPSSGLGFEVIMLLLLALMNYQQLQRYSATSWRASGGGSDWWR